MSLVVFSSCVQDDDFDTPDVTIEEPTLDGPIVTIGSVAGQLQQAIDDGDDTVTFEFDSNSDYMEGYVISTDEGGNFFEEIIIQDKLENPTTGIRILIDVNPLFTRYEVGRKIYVKLDGLTAGISNGVLTIGVNSNNEAEKIPSFLEDSTIFRSAETGTLIPLPLAISEFSNDKTNLFIKLENVQFNRDEVLGDDPKTFAAEESDDFDGERLLESCDTGNSTIFSTSTFADFKALQLPIMSGSLNGILSKNFFGDAFNVNVNSPEDINFDNPERCDPIELACGLAATTGSNNLFEDDFEDQTINSLISGNGWTNYIEAGTEGWEAYTQSGTNASQGISARVGSFNSGDASTVAWLITPQIDLDANTGVTLNFETSNSFSDGSTMQVLFSNDWDGTEAGVTSATWGIVSDAYVTQDSDFFGDWFESGNVDLSCASGQIHIAFKYVGSGEADFDGTYELDFVTIDAQ
ncbi:DUF5689 domain-containing protein [Psychroserpens sp. Hel_I_66]|uniref:DUF5689 domain-containing protein n=1 Tax=Psychroserpens sp. Hel_I_66 TaxID=1250004 RepID=UPI001E4A71E3|nr:DUF5689 domain-containing protein [Psychroserpens sp. Hel_I_66]